MIGEFCRFYHWRDDYVLKMPAARFFAMRRAMSEIQARDVVEQLDIAAVAIGGAQYYEKVRGDYAARMPRGRRVGKAISVSHGPGLEFSSPTAQRAVKAMFRSLKGFTGG